MYLFGAPVVIKQKECLRTQSVVAGRFVNGYKRNDWILGYLFRATSTGIGRVAGLRPIENCGDIENMDCTETVQGHLYYRDNMPRLMKEAGFLVVGEEFDEMEDPDPDKHRERQIALYDEIEEAKKLVAQEEEEARKLGKKVQKPRKSGFLGLWGKEIQEKPVISHAKKTPNAQVYDPYEDKGAKTSGDIGKKPGSTKSTEAEDEVLFDVDKMREELAANGITMTSLESTLPALVVSPPQVTSTPPMQKSSTPPITAAIVPQPTPPASLPAPSRTHSPSRSAVSRTHSPSLPSMSRNNTSAANNYTEWGIQPRNVTPKRELEMLVVDTKKAPTKLSVPIVKNYWDDEPEERGEISMSFEQDAPQTIRSSRFRDLPSSKPCSPSTSTLQGRPEIKHGTSVLSIPIERNVWDDDDYGSEGNITMSFE